MMEFLEILIEPRSMITLLVAGIMAAVAHKTWKLDWKRHELLVRIIPVVLLVILLVLMALLRAVLLPVLLIGTVILSFFATLGLGAIVFNTVLGFPGADPSVPLYAFVFLAALGIDYNIFLMTRAREETQTSGTRRGILKSLAVTGGVITSAGIVLAATFGAPGRNRISGGIIKGVLSSVKSESGRMKCTTVSLSGKVASGIRERIRTSTIISLTCLKFKFVLRI